MRASHFIPILMKVSIPPIHRCMFLFETLLGFQIDNYIKINSVEIRHKSNATNLKKQKTIGMLLNLYKCNSISRIQFIQNVCHNFEK
jgi:hypothetical protein